MTNPSELVVVGVFSQPHEAHLACSAIQAAGLYATVADANVVAADWLVSNAVGGVKVLVRAENPAQAQEVLLTQAVVEQDDDVQFDAAGEDRNAVTCPRCGSDGMVRVTRGKRIAVASWLLAGVPLFPVWHKQECRNCGLVFD